jgi:hypothetical protein
VVEAPGVAAELAADPVGVEVVGDVDVLLVDELAKFHPLIWTPWITEPVPVMVIVVGTHEPDAELMGVMTWPLVRAERHSVASPAGRIAFWYAYPLGCCQSYAPKNANEKLRLESRY